MGTLVIPLSSRALMTLPGTPRGISERVYEVSPNAFRLAWDRLRNRVDIEYLHFHDLRHEANSNQSAEVGVKSNCAGGMGLLVCGRALPAKQESWVNGWKVTHYDHHNRRPDDH